MRYQARSIPACTGEPQLCRHKGARNAVYPRVYGGTSWIDLSESSDASERSIPACTGEP